MIICQSWSFASLYLSAGVTFEQFAWFLRQSEEQISMVILEASANQLLYKAKKKSRSENDAIPFSSLNLSEISAVAAIAAAYYPLYSAFNLSLKNYSPPFRPFRLIT
jgi:hypothetical protein